MLRRWILRGALMAAILAIAALLVLLFNPGLLRDPLQTLISSRTGRTFTIEGDFDLQWGRQLNVVASGIRLGNPAWASEPELVTLERLELTLDTASLFRGPLVIDSLSVEGLRANLEEDDSGRQTWAFAPGPAKAEPEAAAALGLLLRSAAFRNVRLTLTTPALARPLDLRIESLEQRHAEKDLLEIWIAGEVNGTDLGYEGSIGPYANLLAGTGVTFDGAGYLGSLQIRGEAVLDNLLAPEQPSAALILEGPEIADVTRLLGLDDLGTGPYRLELQAQPQEGRLVSQLDGNMGPYRIAVRGETENLSQLDSGNLEVRAAGHDLGVFTHLLGLGAWPHEPFELEGAIARDGPHISISDMELQVGPSKFSLNAEIARFPTLDGASIRLLVQGPDVASFRQLLGVYGVAEGPFEIDGSLEVSPEGVELIEFRGSTGLGSVVVSGTLGGDGGFVGTRLQIGMDGPDAAAVGTAFGVPGFRPRPFTARSGIVVEKAGITLEPGAFLQVADTRIELSGYVHMQPLERSTDIRFRLNGPDVTVVLALSEISAALQPAEFDIGGRLQVLEDAFRFDGLAGRIGRTEMTADGMVSKESVFDGLDMRLTAEGPNLGELLVQSEEWQWPPTPFRFSVHALGRGDTLEFRDTRLSGPDADLRADLALAWPLSNRFGRFTIEATAGNAQNFLPQAGGFAIEALPLELNAHGDWSDGRWKFERLSLALDQARLNLSGQLDAPPDMSATGLQLEIDIPDLAALGTFDGQPLPAASARLLARLAGNTTAFESERFELALGDSDLKGTVIVDLGSAVPRVSLQGRGEVLDLRPLLHSEPEPPAGKAAAADDNRLIPDIPLPLEALAQLNAEVDLHIGKLMLERGSYLNTELRGRLESGALDIDYFRGEGASGYLEGSGSLTPAQEGGAIVQADLTGDGLSLNLHELLATERAKLPVFDIDIRLDARGHTTRELAGSLNGHLAVISQEGGILPGKNLQILQAPLTSQVLGAVFPGLKPEDEMVLRCFAAKLEATDGMLKTAPGIALQTARIQLVADGKVNLKTERLDFNFQTTVNKALSATATELINPYVKIGGTLAQPRISLDAGRALLFGGAAFTTGGLSILAKAALDRIAKSSNPCAAYVEETASAD
ncbi:MAG: AsmA family protein [Xanthomonadales bacterium]|nr:AsmA family protein [Xanthomonadales bacterium]NIN58924.1 AsmA family protein [Xanthomonadales bacterium]NIN74193.1 AsmA family protein [Xanthomonadales bacterium]NIO13864.1 AsmA family protein [Xanthomonadales bacterium]NIP11317.1 AsmA family protein [Xanthomonadales bacterium]